ncbi:MAG TPA: GAF domain-containing sensor histidine kinase [Candidatus Saccharimonadales bacterium]|nr:GAF domain-containing sensor histidine kinase [Candidatus Saccharimonadales bacterium]
MVDRVHPEVPPGAYDALDTATRAVAGLRSVDAVLQVIVDQVRPLVGARYAALGIVDAHGVIERFITSGIDDETRARIGALPRGHGFLGLIMREDRAFRIPDVMVDPRRYGFPPHHPPMHSFLGVPVDVRGRSVGNLYLTDKEGAAEFSAADEDVVAAFARHAGIAMENARLHEQVQRLAILDERERISTDLHDGIIQSLYGVGLSLEDVPELLHEDPGEVEQRVERAIESLHLAIRDIRSFIFGLRPELLGGMTLAGGIASLAQELRHSAILEVEIDTERLAADPEPDVVTHLLGIVNEALSNVARHSGSGQAWVSAETDSGGGTVVAVRDDGRGFDPTVGSGLGHQGVANMRSRASGIGATLDIESSPGAGSLVRVTVPGDASRDADSRGEP